MINLNYVEAFVAVSEYGDTYKAAEKLFTAQQSISRQIKKLENELGYSLFIRNGRHLQLTPFGFKAFKRAKTLIKLSKEFETLTESLESENRISIGASIDTLVYFVPEVIFEFNKVNDSHMEVYPGRSRDIIQMINEGVVDLGIISAKSPSYSNLNYTDLFEDPLSILYSPKHFDIKNQSPESVFEKPFILHTERTSVRHDIDRMFERLNILPDIRIETDDIEAITQLTRAGLGITILPSSVCLPLSLEAFSQLPLTKVFSNDEIELSRQVTLVSPKWGPITRLGQLWIEICVQKAQSLR